MSDQNRQSGRKDGPGEQIRPRSDAERVDEENVDLDNLRGGADPTGGQSKEVPRDNGRSNPGAQGNVGSVAEQRDAAAPPNEPSDGIEAQHPTEDDLASPRNDLENGDK